MARNRKYIEVNTMGRLVWAGAALNKKEINNLEARGVAERTGREITLDTDFAVQGDVREWDREAAFRIGKEINETVEVVRF